MLEYLPQTHIQQIQSFAVWNLCVLPHPDPTTNIHPSLETLRARLRVRTHTYTHTPHRHMRAEGWRRRRHEAAVPDRHKESIMVAAGHGVQDFLLETGIRCCTTLSCLHTMSCCLLLFFNSTRHTLEMINKLTPSLLFIKPISHTHV